MPHKALFFNGLTTESRFWQSPIYHNVNHPQSCLSAAEIPLKSMPSFDFFDPFLALKKSKLCTILTSPQAISAPHTENSSHPKVIIPFAIAIPQKHFKRLLKTVQTPFKSRLFYLQFRNIPQNHHIALS